MTNHQIIELVKSKLEEDRSGRPDFPGEAIEAAGILCKAAQNVLTIALDGEFYGDRDRRRMSAAAAGCAAVALRLLGKIDL